ncbi:hypothetical protein F4815DRAFT_478580, partial [Daldinia loculata]
MKYTLPALLPLPLLLAASVSPASLPLTKRMTCSAGLDNPCQDLYVPSSIHPFSLSCPLSLLPFPFLEVDPLD